MDNKVDFTEKVDYNFFMKKICPHCNTYCNRKCYYRLKAREYYKDPEHREKRKLNMKKYLEKNLEKFKEYQIKYKRINKKHSIKSSKIYRTKCKQTCINHYGGKCVCCGESVLAFLSLDHINNDGAKHRKETTRGGLAVYRWIINNNFPPLYQVLCFNCNWGKYVNNGICPHQSVAV